MAFTPAPALFASPRAGSACERAHVSVRVFARALAVFRRRRPITLASTDVTGSEECKECGGAGAGVSILGPGQREGGGGPAQYRPTAQLCCAG